MMMHLNASSLWTPKPGNLAQKSSTNARRNYYGIRAKELKHMPVIRNISDNDHVGS